MEDFEKYVGENKEEYAWLYPFKYSVTRGKARIYGIAKTKEEAIDRVKEALKDSKYDKYDKC